MIETGEKVLQETRFASVGAACIDVRSRRRALLCGIAGLALLAGVAAPVTMDGPDGAIGVKSALAGGAGVGGGGSGGGGEGGGGGIGGGSEGKRHFPDKSGDDDDGGDDDGPGGGGDGGDSADGSDGGANTAGNNRGGGGAAADVASAAGFDAIQAVEGAPAGSLPTVQEIFALPDDAVLSSADEMRFISQGWARPAE